TYGNGQVVPIPHTQGMRPRVARSANTTANSCAISMSSGVAHAPLRGRTSAKPTATFFRQTHAGSSWESAWLKASPNPVRCGRVKNLFTAMKIRSDAYSPLHDLEPSVDMFFDELLRGLSRHPKSIPPKFFYDETGCELFDEICCLDEYYLTRTETRILREKVAEICALFGPNCRLVEFGSGSNAKTRILLDHLHAPAAYVPVDIAREHLLQCTATLARVYPELSIAPVCADFTAAFTLPEMACETRRTVAFFPGSTIGNLEPVEAENFLRRIAILCG